MSAVAAPRVPDPEVDFLIDAGDGSWSAPNVVLAAADVPVKLDPQHWLRRTSGCGARVEYRQLEVAFLSALFVEPAAAAGLLVARAALGPEKMAGALRAAITAGLSSEPVGSVEEALRRMAAFIRSKRAARSGDFTVNRAADFVVLPSAAPRSRP